MITLTKLQKKNLSHAIRKYISYECNTIEDAYAIMLSYKCFANASKEIQDYIINRLIENSII